jgi:hypothetical protein
MGGAPVQHIILDHLSIYWSPQTITGAWTSGLASPQTAIKNVTWSNNIIAESLLPQHTAMNFGSNTASLAEAMTDLDIQSNLFFSNSHRVPLLKAKRSRFINNIIYNWSYYAAQVAPGVDVDIVGNLFKAGPLNSRAMKGEITAFLYDSGTCNHSGYMDFPPSLHVAGNKGPWGSPTPDGDNWSMVKRVGCENRSIVGDLSTSYQRGLPLAAAGTPIAVRNVNDIEAYLLPKVGASRRLDCLGNWVSNRDLADARVLDWYQNGRGSEVLHEDEVGGIPRISNGTPCIDSDGDGMPDAWEEMMGLDPRDPSDRNRVHSSGYTMLEWYLNGPVITAVAPSGITVD